MTLLQRGPNGDFVSKAWAGKVAVCIASGPSLNEVQVAMVREARERDLVRVIAVNDNYLIAPFADVLYYADDKWAKWHEQGIRRVWPWARFSAEETKAAFAAFSGQRCTLTMNPAREGLYRLCNRLPDGLSLEPTGLATGKNSGHQALNVAALSGARAAVLLGYDACQSGGVSHAFGEHPDRTRPDFQWMGKAARTTKLALAELGVCVLNCSPGSALDAFQQLPLKDALESLLPAQTASAIPA